VSASTINDLTRTGRISPAQGAQLMELRAVIRWYRQPLWKRIALRLLGVGP
jgi:hypothetical protein